MNCLIEERGYPEWLMMASTIHTDGNTKKVAVAYKDRRRFWMEIDEKYYRLFNDPSMENDYWEDLVDYIAVQGDKNLTEKIYTEIDPNRGC